MNRHLCGTVDPHTAVVGFIFVFDVHYTRYLVTTCSALLNNDYASGTSTNNFISDFFQSFVSRNDRPRNIATLSTRHSYREFTEFFN
jgi:hypothetical protein